jgi:hypothetical protein
MGMNKLIKEFAIEWAKYLDWDFPNDPTEYTFTSDSLSKFAELIVRECMDVGSQWADGLIDAKHYAFVNKKIKQHFGVEE